MLLSVHVTSVLFLVWFNNFALVMGFYWSYMFLRTLVARSYALLIYIYIYNTISFQLPWELAAVNYMQ